MRTFDWVACPEARILGRLVERLRGPDGGGMAFATAGEALASGMLATLPLPLPSELSELADAMVGALLLVERSSEEDPDKRLRLVMSTAVLSCARPHVASACDAAASVWMGIGLDLAAMVDPYAIAGYALEMLRLGDVDAADEAVAALLDRNPGFAGPLHDWVVARQQRHGEIREAQCFHHLRVALAADAGSGDGPSLLVTGAVTLHDLAGHPRSRVRPWLDELALDLAREGTTARLAR